MWFSSTRQDKRPGQKANPCVVLVLVLVLVLSGTREWSDQSIV